MLTDQMDIFYDESDNLMICVAYPFQNLDPKVYASK